MCRRQKKTYSSGQTKKNKAPDITKRGDPNVLAHGPIMRALTVYCQTMSICSRFPRNSSLSSDDRRVRSSHPGSIVNVGRSLAVGGSCGYESGKSLSFPREVCKAPGKHHCLEYRIVFLGLSESLLYLALPFYCGCA